MKLPDWISRFQYPLVFLYFLCLSLVITWPLIFNLNRLIIDPIDGLLIDWIINWDIHSLLNGWGGILGFYNANIFYPYHSTLAFSDLHLPEALIASPFVYFFKEPLLAYNVNFLAGYVLTGLVAFLLTKFLSASSRKAIVLATVFTFSTIHLNYQPHLQLFNIWPVILAIYGLLSQKYKLYVISSLVAILLSPLNLYFILFAATVCFLIFRSTRQKVVLYTFFLVCLVSPFLLPFYWVSKSFHYMRPITDAIHFSLQFPGLLTPGSASRLSEIVPLLTKTTPAFLGISFTLLILYLLYFLFKCRKSKLVFANSILTMSVIGALISFVLSLGPALHIFENTVHLGPVPALPLPYLLFYYLIPGFSGFRTPSRWILLAALFLIMAIAVSFRGKKTVSGSKLE